MSSSSESISNLFPLIATTAAATVTGLVALQSDVCSRYLLDPAQLDAKRRNGYSYQWSTAVEKTHLQLDYYLAGGPQKLHDDAEIIFKETDYLSKEEDLEHLVHLILDKKEALRFFPLKMDRDPQDPAGEFYLYILQDAPAKATAAQLYQVPLMKFALLLAEAFENQLTTTTFCFVADASSGRATTLLEQLVAESKTGVAVLPEPMWMVELARLTEAKLFPSNKLDRLLFALCRLEAWVLRDLTTESRTVLVTLPGQATVSTLLPMVQRVFPEDRHVFAYDGCVASVQRGLLEARNYRRRDVEQRLQGIIHTMCHNPVRHTTPLPSHSPLTKKLPTLTKSLSQLPVNQASIVECWMSSVDTYFDMKSNEATNGYLPYAFKMGFLTHPSDLDFLPKSDSYWSLCSLLQYITGHRSQPLSEGVVDAAIEFVKDWNSSAPTKLVSVVNTKAIENAVFQHKSILIGNKTLQDTVLPKQHWTLKQAARNGGCACCGPDPFDEEEEENNGAASNSFINGVDMSTPGAFAVPFDVKAKQSTSNAAGAPSGFVDGKLGFAFDPTRFS